MKIRKRFVVIGSMIGAILVLAGLGIAGAGCGPHFGPLGGGFHRFHAFDGDMPDFVLKRLDGKIKDLNLTPVQKTKYDELRGRLKERLVAMKEDRRNFRHTVRAELAKESPDIAALNALLKKKIETMSGALQNDLDLFADFYSTLDETQKQKVVAGIRQRMAARDASREERQ